MRRLAFLVVALASLPARAHIGAVVANARFTNPPPPSTTPTDGGVVLAPFTLDSVDVGNPYVINWSDGDLDPTGRFFFYYADHDIPFGVTADDVEQTVGTPIPDGANGVWASCTCSGDQGVVCPDVTTRDCRNFITWTPDKPGTYWIIAVNNDPPFHVYSTSLSPVRVNPATGSAPPAIVPLRPDGVGTWDTTYRAQWLAVGTPPLKVDIAYGVDVPMAALQTPTPIAMNVMGTPNADGTTSWDWDLSSLPNNDYFLVWTITDGNGVTAFTDSRYAVTVYHPNLDAGGFDLHEKTDGLTLMGNHPSGCEVTPDRTGAFAVFVPLVLLGLAIVFLAFRVARK